MKILSEQLTRENEDYLTIPAIRKFAKQNKIKKISEYDRPELIKELEDFGHLNPKNAEVLQDWFEEVISEGIKTLYMVKAQDIRGNYQKMRVTGMFNQYITNKSGYISTTVAEKFLTLYKIKEYNTILGDVVRFSFVKKVCYQSRINENISVIKIPIQIVLLLQCDIILIQFKSKSGLYEYEEKLENVSETITDGKLVTECLKFITDNLKLNIKTSTTNKNTLYNLLIKYTQTPKIIKEKINGLRDKIENISEDIRYKLCKVNENNKQDIIWDITNIIEKYISINTEDKSIFIDDREAYPIKLISSDEEDSRVEQCSGNVEPLQTKSIFFDNKKMLQKSKQCDGIILKYHRLDNKYFNNEVDVHIQVKSKYMVVKFTRYTMQEDIENVLNSIISSESKSWNIK